MKSYEKQLRILIKEIIKSRSLLEQSEDSQAGNSKALVVQLKSAFSGFKGVLEKSFQSSYSDYSTKNPYDISHIENLALKNNDSILEVLARAAFLISDIHESLNANLKEFEAISQKLDSESHLVGLDVANAEPKDLEDFLNFLNIFTGDVGNIIGRTSALASLGSSQGKQSLQQHFASLLKVKDTNSESLKSFANYIKALEKLNLQDQYTKLVKSKEAEEWGEKNKSKYSNEYDIIERAFKEWLPKIGENIPTCKTYADSFYEISLQLEDITKNIEHTALNQVKVEKEEEEEQEKEEV